MPSRPAQRIQFSGAMVTLQAWIQHTGGNSRWLFQLLMDWICQVTAAGLFEQACTLSLAIVGNLSSSVALFANRALHAGLGLHHLPGWRPAWGIASYQAAARRGGEPEAPTTVGWSPEVRATSLAGPNTFSLAFVRGFKCSSSVNSDHLKLNNELIDRQPSFDSLNDRDPVQEGENEVDQLFNCTTICCYTYS